MDLLLQHLGCSTGWDEMCCIGEAMLAHAVALASAWILLCNRCDLPRRGEQRHHAVTLEPAFSCRQGTTKAFGESLMGIAQRQIESSLNMFLLLWLHGLCHIEREREAELSESETKIEEGRVETVMELATLITQVWKLFSRFVKSNFRRIDSCLDYGCSRRRWLDTL